MPVSFMVRRNASDSYPCMSGKCVDKGGHDGSRNVKQGSGNDSFIASLEKEKRLTGKTSTSDHSVVSVKACSGKVEADADTKKAFIFEKNKFRCAGCLELYTTAKELSDHSCDIYKKEDDFICHKCDKGFKTNANLFSHLRWCNKK